MRTPNKPRAIVSMSLVLTLLASSLARAQDQPPPPPAEPPPGTTAPTSSSIRDITPTSPAAPSPTTTTPQTTPTATPTTITFGSQPAVPAAGSPPRALASPDMAARWRHARNLGNAGMFFGVSGMALTLSSVIYVGVTGYPCNPNDPIAAANPNNPCNQNNMLYKNPQPTDPAPMLGYVGATSSALGFILSASSLGYQHYLLAKLDADPGRGLFGAGTVFGVLGFVTVGVSYFVGLTNYLNPRDQALAILGTSITSTFFSVLGSLLYMIDSQRTKRAWNRLPTTY